MNHAKMSLAARRQKWLELVAEYRRRGISAALFCKEHGFRSGRTGESGLFFSTRGVIKMQALMIKHISSLHQCL